MRSIRDCMVKAPGASVNREFEMREWIRKKWVWILGVFGAIDVFLARFERFVDWLSGSVPANAKAALQNVKAWWSGMPILGNEAVQHVLDILGLVLLAVFFIAVTIELFKKRSIATAATAPSYPRAIPCPQCDGTAKIHVVGGFIKPCGYCKASGEISGHYLQYPQCRFCEGRGKVMVVGGFIKPCSICNGLGRRVA